MVFSNLSSWTYLVSRFPNVSCTRMQGFWKGIGLGPRSSPHSCTNELSGWGHCWAGGLVGVGAVIALSRSPLSCFLAAFLCWTLPPGCLCVSACNHGLKLWAKINLSALKLWVPGILSQWWESWWMHVSNIVQSQCYQLKKQRSFWRTPGNSQDNADAVLYKQKDWMNINKFKKCIYWSFEFCLSNRL